MIQAPDAVRLQILVAELVTNMMFFGALKASWGDPSKSS